MRSDWRAAAGAATWQADEPSAENRHPRRELAVQRKGAAWWRPPHGVEHVTYGQAEVRSTVFEVTGMPATVGVLSESAEVPVAVAE